MRRFHQFFQQPEAGRLKTILDYEHASRNLNVCWYPSAGMDFRHIRYFEEERLASDITYSPLLYIHSDMLIKSDKSDGIPFANNEYPTSEIEIGECFEIHPKKLSYYPSDDIWGLGSNQFSGKVFALHLFYYSMHKGRKIRISVPMVYFGYENLNLLVDFFLANQIRISTLVHIKDGGSSMGGSRIPMNFIYQVSDILRIRRVISDESVALKNFNPRESCKVLKNQCYKSDNYAVCRLSSLFKDRPFDSVRKFEHIFHTQWTEKVIPLYRYGYSTYSEQLDRYYDWKKIASY